jgi:hypothetical protein
VKKMITVALVVLALAGCAPSVDPAREAAFVSAMEVRYGPDGAKVAANLAKNFCGRPGLSSEFEKRATEFMAEGLGQGISTADTGAIIGAGVPTYCPQNIPDLEAWLAN